MKIFKFVVSKLIIFYLNLRGIEVNSQAQILSVPILKIRGNAKNIQIGKASILSVFAQSTAADGEVKLYNESDGSKTAARLIFHGKFGAGDNAVHEFKIPAAGIYASDGIYADVTNVDFLYIIGTF